MSDEMKLQFSVGVFMHPLMTLAAHSTESAAPFREAFIAHLSEVMDVPNMRSDSEDRPQPTYDLTDYMPDDYLGPVWSSPTEEAFRAAVNRKLDEAVEAKATGLKDPPKLELGDPMSAGCAPVAGGGWTSSRIYCLTTDGKPWFCDGVVDKYEEIHATKIEEPTRSLLVTMPICAIYSYETPYDM